MIRLALILLFMLLNLKSTIALTLESINLKDFYTIFIDNNAFDELFPHLQIYLTDQKFENFIQLFSPDYFSIKNITFQNNHNKFCFLVEIIRLHAQQYTQKVSEWFIAALNKSFWLDPKQKTKLIEIAQSLYNTKAQLIFDRNALKIAISNAQEEIPEFCFFGDTQES